MDRNWQTLDRRTLIQLGTGGLAALALPGAARAWTAGGFTHGVASGEPGAHSVLLWTRYAAASDTPLTVEIAESPDFVRIVAGGTALAQGDRDHSAKLVVDGLTADRWYFYRFIAPDGTRSLTGRTRTLPEGPCARFNLALFSCSNLPFGWFNAYAHAASRSDIDMAVHVGDYLYEYRAGDYPSERQALPGRLIQPTHEMVALADYRLRYAAYRADADLQRVHQLFPMIAQWDDHEFANDAWKGGAQNHDADEGAWSDRIAAAERAYREWMPVADSRWRHYQIGDLATIFLPETRITARDKPFDLGDITADSRDPVRALTAFRDGDWRRADRQLLGADQESWLFSGFASSVKAGTRWQVCAQQVLMGTLVSPPEARDWFGDKQPDFIRRRVELGQLATRAGLPMNMDMWDGYPAARARLLGAAQRAGANLVSLAGDSHNAWAFDLKHKGRGVGVEIGGHSVTSPGFEAYTRGIGDDVRTRALRAASPTLKWANTQNRGYVTVRMTREAVSGEWHFLNTIRERDAGLAGTHRMTVRHGRRAYDAL